MKKVLALPFFAVMVLVSQAFAEECKVGGQQLYCQIGGGCFKYSTEYSGVGSGSTATCRPSDPTEAARFPSGLPVCTCDQLLAGCQDYGQAYTGVDPSVTDEVHNWGNGQTCSSGTPYGSGAQKCGTCQYPTGCYAIWSGGPDTKGDNCTTAMATCAEDGGTTGCTEGSNPIISYNITPVVGLNVTYFARSLQIASGRDATVSLFDISGKQMFSQKVFSGTTTISLENQKLGIYYAVVKAGSQKETVKIILK